MLDLSAPVGIAPPGALIHGEQRQVRIHALPVPRFHRLGHAPADEMQPTQGYGARETGGRLDEWVGGCNEPDHGAQMRRARTARPPLTARTGPAAHAALAPLAPREPRAHPSPGAT